MRRSNLVVRSREHRASILVATLSTSFGVLLLMVTAMLNTILGADDTTGSSGTVAVMLAVLAAVFLALAVYVGAIVTSNTFATIVAGRTRTIALLRLIGSTAREQRRSVAREGVFVGLLGAALGLLIGLVVAFALVRIGVATDALPDLAYPLVQVSVLLPVVAVVLTTWLASWIGARRVLVVTPMQAVGGAQEASREETLARPGRNITAIILFVLGILLVLGGAVIGLVTPAGVLVGVFGGMLSFTGLVLGANVVMPPVLRLVGRLFGGSAPARLAAENAVRHPERSARTTIGLVIGVTLVTMFAVASSTFQAFARSIGDGDPQAYAMLDAAVQAVVAVFSALVGFSALIAAVGMVNNLSLSVLQRTRELGLLRALGFSVGQVRRMIVTEAAQLTISAVVVGLVLGVFYGWAGAQAMFGSVGGSFITPAVPWLVVVVIIVLAALLTAAASVTPSRRATRVSPVAALAVD
ncbi:ABC transporter permease [Plantibacter flavus]|uniref:ABC transporter permease n=1 Tax=Plantibacter flavus TaxID=150123 RepID=UPI003F16E693